MQQQLAGRHVMHPGPTIDREKKRMMKGAIRKCRTNYHNSPQVYELLFLSYYRRYYNVTWSWLLSYCLGALFLPKAASNSIRQVMIQCTSWLDVVRIFGSESWVMKDSSRDRGMRRPHWWVLRSVHADSLAESFPFSKPLCCGEIPGGSAIQWRRRRSCCNSTLCRVKLRSPAHSTELLRYSPASCQPLLHLSRVCNLRLRSPHWSVWLSPQHYSVRRDCGDARLRG